MNEGKTETFQLTVTGISSLYLGQGGATTGPWGSRWDHAQLTGLC